MNAIVITPTYNERNNIQVLVSKIFALYPTVKILVVDDNSPDGTANVAKELQRTFPNLYLKERPGKLGLASAYLQSFEYVLREFPDIEAIITMDADLSHDPSVIGRMLKEIESYDLVIGSRYVRGGSVEDWEVKRQLLSVCGNFYARVISGVPIHDLTAGNHCFRTSLLSHQLFRNITATGFAFQMELKMFAYVLRARILEMPINFKNRVDGESKISRNIIYEGLIVPWILRWRLLRLTVFSGTKP